MQNYSSYDVLSPRELRRQIFQYFLFSMLFWMLLTGAGVVLGLDLEVVPGKSLSFFAMPSLLGDFLWRLCVLLIFSALWGALLALPSVIFVWMANTGNSFAPSAGGVSARVRRGGTSLLAPLFCVVLHVSVLLVSLSASPIFATRLDGGKGLFWKPMSALYDLFYEEPASEIAKGWRKSLSESKTSLLIVALPARVLENPKNFPLLEKEMGAAIPFFMSAGSFDVQLAEIFQLKADLSADFSLLGTSQNVVSEAETRDVQWILAPGVMRPGGGSQEAVSSTLFLSQRMGLGLPHLGFWGRVGFLGALFHGMEWENLDADDAHSLGRFLTLVRERPDAQVRVLQLSALGVSDSLRALRPRRYPVGMGDDISSDALRVLDLKLGRALGAIRQERKLSVVVMPYPERFHDRVFSNIFVRLGEGVSDSFLAHLSKPNTSATVADVALLRSAQHSRGAALDAESGPECRLMRVAPELFQKDAAAVRADLFRSAYAFVEPSEENVVAVPREARALGSGIYRTAAFCRSRTGDSRLVVWFGDGGVSFSEKQWPVVQDEIFSTVGSIAAPKNVARSKGTVAKPSDVPLLPPIALRERLMVYRVSAATGVEVDPAAEEYVAENVLMLRRVFSEVVEEPKAQ